MESGVRHSNWFHTNRGAKTASEHISIHWRVSGVLLSHLSQGRIPLISFGLTFSLELELVLYASLVVDNFELGPILGADNHLNHART
jgi:hypothetical protein